MSEDDRVGDSPGQVEPVKRARGSARPLLREFFRSLAYSHASRVPHADRDARHAIELCHALLSERHDVGGTRLAMEALRAYQGLGPSALTTFFDLLAGEFAPDATGVARAADAYRASPSQANLIRLQTAVDPPRQELFRRLNMAPATTGVLVGMRRQVLQGLAEHPGWAGIDADFMHLFRSWFNCGFLTLQRIDWRTSALILERLIHYEAVHQIQGWRDLRRRLDADRRCYAFFHPALPDEPLIFIEVALTRGMPGKVQPLLDPDSPVVDPAGTNCAIFYSITNCQEGLRGVSFGNFLIKQVVEDLGRRFRRLKTFATLSPIPGFAAWLTTAESSALPTRISPELTDLLERIKRNEPLTPQAIGNQLQGELSRLCAHYLLNVKRERAPLDPVARFHLANGAGLERLNWMGDTSVTGLSRSFGMTVNYGYRLGDVERNHEAYAKEYRVVASGELKRLARQPFARRTG
jgi:malonyl-CoA decarboxylase